MIVKVSQVAAEFRRVSNKQMADTTKRTIKENVSINNQLHKMSKKVIDLIEEGTKEKEKVCKIILLYNFVILPVYFIFRDFSTGQSLQAANRLARRERKRVGQEEREQSESPTHAHG